MKPKKPRVPVHKHGPQVQRSHEIRIIGGLWKRTKLKVADKPGLRPTPDRVRETLFNWLGQDLSGWRCADIFAGSGALGFEAASRGAAHVLLVEQQSGLVQQLLSVVQRLGASAVKVERGDGVAALQRIAASSLDLVLIDPPFESTRYEAALQAAAAALRRRSSGPHPGDRSRSRGSSPEPSGPHSSASPPLPIPTQASTSALGGYVTGHGDESVMERVNSPELQNDDG